MPVDLATLGAFAVAAGAIAVSPGPDTMLILRYALTSGRAAGLAAVAGVQIGLVVHTALAAAGVSALIASSPAVQGTRHRRRGLPRLARLAGIP